MGFPMGYSELLLPKFLLQMVFFLGFIRQIISRAFNVAGLGDLLDSDSPWPDPSSIIQAHHHHHHHHHQIHQHHQNQHQNHPHQFQSVSALLIQEILPVVKLQDLKGYTITDDSCAICLYEFEGEDEVRRLSNCRHVYHRCCLDRWMEHDQRTCPLCRTPLIPDEMQDAFHDRMWAAAGVPDSSYLAAEFDSYS